MYGKGPYEDEFPCDVCGRSCDSCICPDCPSCGVAGDPDCYIGGPHKRHTDHGLTYSEDQQVGRAKAISNG